MGTLRLRRILPIILGVGVYFARLLTQDRYPIITQDGHYLIWR
jgi:hypothetical protein